MTQATALANAIANNAKTVLDYGADPTGKNDSSAAFIKMAQDEGSTAIRVPDGAFTIDATVDLKRKNLIGCGRRHVGKKPGNYITTRKLRGENGVLFTNNGVEVRGVNFYGLGKGTAIDAYAYNVVFEDIQFEELGTGVLVRGGTVNFNMIRCYFTFCEYGFHQTARTKDNTTFRAYNCEHNNSGNAFVFDGKLYGATFQDNIFEHLTGDAVLARIVYDCNFIGNWWEVWKGDKDKAGSKGYPTIRSFDKQQIFDAYGAANHVVYGWHDVLTTDEEGGNGGNAGGVSTDNTAVRVRSSTGNAVVVTSSMIRSSRAEWKPYGPFVLQAGRSESARWPQSLHLRTGGIGRDGARGDVVLAGYPTDKDAGPFTTRLAMLKSADLAKKGIDNPYSKERHEYIQQVWDAKKRPVAGFTGGSELDDTHVARTGVPVQAVVSEDKNALGLEVFSKIDRSKAGEVTFSLPYALDRTTVQVMVEDRGIDRDGLAISGDKLTVYFVERSTGKAVTPKTFHLAFNTHAK